MSSDMTTLPFWKTDETAVKARSPQELRDRVGEAIGASPWMSFTQAEIDAFGVLTRDPDPMHMDPEWCRTHSPFPSTVLFGFMTLSMLTSISHQIYDWSHDSSAFERGYGLNYGFDRIRFIEPVPVNARFRGHFKVLACYDRAPGEQMTKFEVVIEVEAEERPALVAEWMGLWVEGDAHVRIQGKRPRA
jgi:acyl dehydratase